MPHYTHIHTALYSWFLYDQHFSHHFINIDFLSNHKPTEFHFSCDSLQSVFSAYNSSVITLSDANPRSVPEHRDSKEAYSPKAPLGTEAWKGGRGREYVWVRDLKTKRERTEWLKKTGRERVGKQSGWPVSVSPWTAWHPRGGRLLQPVCDQSWQLLGQMGLSCRLRVCVGAKKRGGARKEGEGLRAGQGCVKTHR